MTKPTAVELRLAADIVEREVGGLPATVRISPAALRERADSREPARPKRWRLATEADTPKEGEKGPMVWATKGSGKPTEGCVPHFELRGIFDGLPICRRMPDRFGIEDELGFVARHAYVQEDAPRIPTEADNPVLPRVRVRDGDHHDWVDALFLRMTDHPTEPFLVLRHFGDGGWSVERRAYCEYIEDNLS